MRPLDSFYGERKSQHRIKLGTQRGGGAESGAVGRNTSGPSPPSEGSGSRSSLMCRRERKRLWAASWLICRMLLSASEDISLRTEGGDSKPNIGKWPLNKSPTLTKGLAPTKMTVHLCSTS